MTLRRVDFMNTAFRDGFQSVYGARVFTDDFIPAVEAAAAAGLTHFEAGGGARFQSTYSVESWVAQNSRSSSSFRNSGIGFNIDLSFLAVHVSRGDNSDLICPNNERNKQ